MPDCCIGVDVIVGFPGETDADFEETYRYLNDLNISYLHVFTYSERDNTLAVTMPGSIPPNVRAERSARLHMLSDKKRRFFYESQVGKDFNVLFENDIENNRMHGFTENYIRVAADYDPLAVNDIRPITLTAINGSCVGEVVERVIA